MHTTRDIDALQQLPEGQAISLSYSYWDDVTFQVNVNHCYYTCNVTQVNSA
jgi:hypothetical protein